MSSTINYLNTNINNILDEDTKTKDKPFNISNTGKALVGITGYLYL